MDKSLGRRREFYKDVENRNKSSTRARQFDGLVAREQIKRVVIPS